LDGWIGLSRANALPKRVSKKQYLHVGGQAVCMTFLLGDRGNAAEALQAAGGDKADALRSAAGQ
jgi:hypothetical protein